MSAGQKYHCGPDSWSPAARKVLTFILNNDACETHDKDWAQPDADKSKSDKKFLKNLFTWWKPWTWFVAPIAYGAVAWGGQKTFKEAQEKAQKSQ